MPTLAQLGIEIDPTPALQGKAQLVGALGEIKTSAGEAAASGKELGDAIGAGVQKAAVAADRATGTMRGVSQATANVAAVTQKLREQFLQLSPAQDKTAASTEQISRAQKDLTQWMAKNPPVIRDLSQALATTTEQYAASEAARQRWMADARAFTGSALATPPPTTAAPAAALPPAPPAPPPAHAIASLGGLPAGGGSASMGRAAIEAKAVGEAESDAAKQARDFLDSVQRSGEVGYTTFEKLHRSMRGTSEIMFALSSITGGALQEHIFRLSQGAVTAQAAFDRLNESSRNRRQETENVVAALQKLEQAQATAKTATDAFGESEKALGSLGKDRAAAQAALATATEKATTTNLQAQLANTKVAAAETATKQAILQHGAASTEAEAAVKAKSAAEQDAAKITAAVQVAQAELATTQTAAIAIEGEFTKATELNTARQAEAALANKAVASSERELVAATDAAKASGGGLIAFLAPFLALFVALVAVIGAVVAAFRTLKSALQLAEQFSEFHDRLTLVIGDSRAAKEELDKLAKFRLGTGFEMPELVEASVRLHAMGYEGDRLISVLHSLGEAAAATGQNTIDPITALLGEIQKQGSVTYDQLQTLAASGLDLFPELLRVTGYSEKAIKAALDANQVSFQQFTAALALATGAGARFGHVLEDQNTGWTGFVRNISQRWEEWKRELGTPILPALEDAFKGFDQWLTKLFSGGPSATGLGDSIAAEIRAGLKAAQDGRFAEWLTGELERAATAFREQFTKEDSYTAAFFDLMELAAGHFWDEMVKRSVLSRLLTPASATPQGPPPVGFNSDRLDYLKNTFQTYGPLSLAKLIIDDPGAQQAAAAIKDLAADLKGGWDKLGQTIVDQRAGAVGGRGIAQQYDFGAVGVNLVDALATQHAIDQSAINAFGTSAQAVQANTQATQQNTQAQQAATQAQKSAAQIIGAGPVRNFGTTPNGAIDLQGILDFGVNDPRAFHGAWGADLTNPNLRGIAITPEQAIDYTGISDGQKAMEAMKNMWVQVINLSNGFTTWAQVVDKGPTGAKGLEVTGKIINEVQGNMNSFLALLKNGIPTGAALAQALANAPSAAGGMAGRIAMTESQRTAIASETPDAAAINAAVQAFDLLNAKQQAGIISLDSYNQQVDELKAKTINGLIDPSKVGQWEAIFGNSLHLAQDQAALATREIELHFAQMERNIADNSASASDSFIYGIQKAAHSYGTFDQQIAKLGGDITNSIGDNFSNFFGDIVTGSKTASQAFKDFAVSLLNDISRMIIKMLVLRAIEQLVGVITGDTGGVAPAGAGFGHGGMIVGGTPTFYRAIDPSVFIGAPRMHMGGLLPGERPIIAKDGEGIFTPEQMSRLAPVGAGARMQSNEFNIEVNVSPQGDVQTTNRNGGISDQDSANSARLLTNRIQEVVLRETHPGGIIDQWGRNSAVARGKG